MSIQFAILGMLSWKPVTGYELKKVFEESSFMHWSGNNNQIYKPLLSLLEQGQAACETVHQEGAPTKKVYSITDEGKRVLREWVRSTPEPMDIRKTFLIQLAWADQLDGAGIDTMLQGYEEEILAQIVMHKEKIRRGIAGPNRTAREARIWEAIHGNILATWQQELSWVHELRQELKAADTDTNPLNK
jgi:DNA-binding PadR family transcriptional regulator